MKKKELKPYPEWVCSDCADAAGGKARGSCATWHMDECGVCGEPKPCTEPRDFNYPRFEGHEYAGD